MSETLQASAFWKRSLPIALAAVLLLAEGYVYGLWTNRWQSNDDVLRSACARLEQVPMIIGDWHGSPLVEISAQEKQQAGFAGYIRRSYKNVRNGAAMSILVACGRPGPISVHTPDICYRGAGYEPTDAIKKHTEKLKESSVEMWQADFRKSDGVSPSQLHVLWSWTTGDVWKAPDNPRVAFAGAPALYKLYVIQETMAEDPNSAKTCSEFLHQVVPELTKQLGS
jgi:uncharacterized protein DUF3485